MRVFEASSELNGHLADDWPAVGQVICRRCRRQRGPQVSDERHCWITSLTADEATPQQLQTYCRGHWTIKNRLHHCRDVTFDEDAANQRCGSAP